MPEIEAELARLNRDYEINKQQYDTLAQRLESARISESAEQNVENVKFRVIEPPIVPVQAERSGARLALNSLVLLAAIAAGVGLAVLLAQLVSDLHVPGTCWRRSPGVPVIGSITAALQTRPRAVVPHARARWWGPRSAC